MEGRRLLIVQIDGLSRAVLREALGSGTMPFVNRLLRRQGFRLSEMSVGLPTSTPAFQLAVMYGVKPDIPGFHYYDRRRRDDVYFPRVGDAARVEATQADGRSGILSGGSSHGCVFSGGAQLDVFTLAMRWRPTGRGILSVVSSLVVLGWVLVKGGWLSIGEVVRAVLRWCRHPARERARGWRWLLLRLGCSIWLRQLYTLVVSAELYAGVRAINVNYVDYDVFAQAFGPRHRHALRALRNVDASIHQLCNVLRRVPEHRYASTSCRITDKPRPRRIRPCTTARHSSKACSTTCWTGGLRRIARCESGEAACRGGPACSATITPASSSASSAISVRTFHGSSANSVRRPSAMACVSCRRAPTRSSTSSTLPPR
jgi:hypothetical protein